MRNDNGSRVAGMVLIGLGVIFLLGIWLRINLWDFFWPGLLIAIGIAVIIRSQATPAGTHSEFLVLGDIDRAGEWPVTNSDTWIGVGDIDLDFTHANIPTGETVLGVRGFVGDVDVIVPQSVGFSVSASGFITNVKQAGREHPVFLGPYRYQSEGYDVAERKIKLETSFFVHELRLRQV